MRMFDILQLTVRMRKFVILYEEHHCANSCSSSSGMTRVTSLLTSTGFLMLRDCLTTRAVNTYEDNSWAFIVITHLFA
jgi:hypothetical protein